jgi:hypothetical protein
MATLRAVGALDINGPRYCEGTPTRTAGDKVIGKRDAVAIVPRHAGLGNRLPLRHLVRMQKQPPAAEEKPAAKGAENAPKPREIGGPKGPEPTRYGDWEVKGRCSDF